MALLDEFHGPMTIRQLQAAHVRPGWQCLEVGAGTGALTAWLAERVAPTGRVLAIDIETHWLEPLSSEIVEIRQADITATRLPPNSFELVLARMLLLHLPDPAEACRQLLAATAPDGILIIQDADFSPISLRDATDLEADGLAVMEETMRAAGVHLALGPKLETLLQAVGARIAEVESEPSPGHGGEGAALITAMTLERFHRQAVEPARATKRLRPQFSLCTIESGSSPARPSGSSAANPPPVNPSKRRPGSAGSVDPSVATPPVCPRATATGRSPRAPGRRGDRLCRLRPEV